MVSLFKRCKFAAKLLAIALVGAGLGAAPAKADVVYDLTYSGGGSGQLVLNLYSTAEVENIAYTSIAPYFVSLTGTNVNGQNFLITPANLASGFISSGAAGQLYTLTVQQSPPAGVPSGTEYLDVFTSTWQIHTTPYDSMTVSGNLTISAPRLANVPEPSGFAVMMAALAGLGGLAWRRQRRSHCAVCA